MSQFAHLLVQCLLVATVVAIPGSVKVLPRLGARQLFPRQNFSTSASNGLGTANGTGAPSTSNGTIPSAMISISSLSTATATVSGTGTPATVTSVVPETATVSPASDSANTMMWSPVNGQGAPQEPVRGSLGADIQGPTNGALTSQNPDALAPPTTDHGVVPNAKWPFSLSSNRLQTGGWARQQNVDVMPIATEMSGVNMRLEPGAIRELHWHTAAEWAYIIKGSTQITAITPDGQNYIATVNEGDLWYFPSGVPHSLQATGDNPNGTEFLLVFNTGDFNEDGTFLLTQWMSQVPKEVLALNFGVDQSAFDTIPGQELYIFPAEPPASAAEELKVIDAPESPTAFTFSMSTMNYTQAAGGSYKVVDSTNFPAAQDIAVADVIVNPGGMRELHWHPNQDEWTYYLSGTARVTLFASGQNARTFNYQAGDIGYVPATYGHYIQNVGTEPLHFLEIFKTPKFEDISLQQWLALLPAQMVQAHLGISDATIAGFNKTKQIVVGGPAPSQPLE